MREDMRELLGAWAVDALDDAEREAVERAITQDADLAREASELRAAVAQLAEAEQRNPPRDLRDRVLGEVARTPQRTASEPPEPEEHGAAGADPDGWNASHSGPSARRSRWRQYALAAVLVIAVAIAGGLAWQQHQRADQLQAQLHTLVDSLAGPDTRVHRAPVEGGGSAALVTSGSGAVFAAAGLEPLPDQDYQLWVIAGTRPTPAGILHLSDGMATVEVDDVPPGATVALTVEPPGGSQQPTTEPVVVLTT